MVSESRPRCRLAGLLALLLALPARSAPTMVSVCGDPGMALPPKILLEGWNFCNRAGRACDTAPRWADCTGPDGVQRVTAAANAAGLPASQQSQPACDAFTEQKERDLGALCADTPPAQGANATSYFWTAMLKSGAFNASERGRLCGLWCAGKDPNCNVPAPPPPPAPRAWGDANYMMRQPRVVQQWSAPDGAGGWHGSFYGTLDQGADLAALPTPAQVIAQALAPPAPPAAPGCSLAGQWLGQGSARQVIAVAQAPGAARFLASCAWPPGTPGLPAPWVNQSGTVDASDGVAFAVGGHVDSGRALLPGGGSGGGGSADLVCWASGSWWCRSGAACNASSAAARCGALPPPPPRPPSGNVSSYFGMEWVHRGGRRVHRHVLRTGNDLGWIMLYTGPEAARGLKGGYEWDGRGQYYTVPQSTTRNASQWDPALGKRPTNNFQVVHWVNITLWPGGPGFYFLNMGACWKDAGVACDGDISTDVTRYLLFQVPAGDADPSKRCGPSPAQQKLCPPYHRYRNGTVVTLQDSARFPYAAYHSVSPREPQSGGGFRCKHDCWSNPADQDWLRIEPSPEWAEYGFPASVAEALSPAKWTMDVGAVTALLSSQFSGATPPVMEWTTLNVGPEMMAAPGAVAVWELAESDVLIEEGSQ